MYITKGQNRTYDIQIGLGEGCMLVAEWQLRELMIEIRTILNTKGVRREQAIHRRQSASYSNR